MFKAIPFKSKPCHDKTIQHWLRELKNIPLMKDLSGNQTLEGITFGEEN